MRASLPPSDHHSELQQPRNQKFGFAASLAADAACHTAMVTIASMAPNGRGPIAQHSTNCARRSVDLLHISQLILRFPPKVLSCLAFNFFFSVDAPFEAVNFLHISPLLLHTTAVLTRTGMTPAEYKSITQGCNNGLAEFQDEGRHALATDQALVIPLRTSTGKLSRVAIVLLCAQAGPQEAVAADLVAAMVYTMIWP